MTQHNPIADPQAFLRTLFDVAVERAQPHVGMAQHLPTPPKGRTLVLGAGKAGGAMAQALEALWPRGAPLSGLVVTRYGHVPPRPAALAVVTGQPPAFAVAATGDRAGRPFVPV